MKEILQSNRVNLFKQQLPSSFDQATLFPADSLTEFFGTEVGKFG